VIVELATDKADPALYRISAGGNSNDSKHSGNMSCRNMDELNKIRMDEARNKTIASTWYSRNIIVYDACQ
jgi:hypothetical protein